jgi:uncharacterized membrane protein YkoI
MHPKELSREHPMNLAVNHIDSRRAEEIAISFLQQHHSISRADKIVLQEGAWLAEFLVSASGKKIIVEVDAETGQILRWAIGIPDL